MKVFEKPVVVLNEMLMNESIASACCYDQKTDGLVTTLIPLNGGTIVKDYRSFSLNPVVLNLLGSYATAPSNHYKLYIPTATAKISYTPGAVPDLSSGYEVKNVIRFENTGTGGVKDVYYVDGSKAPGQAFLSEACSDLYDYNGGAYIQLSQSGCTHSDGNCPWMSETKLSLAHVGATLPHALGMPNWSQPHLAGQYNS
ncbi:MAG: hypothetical protein LBS72_03455 [Oscillospiraceae bacterium]|nr:hypothetical protein [Oscillospiraceae bacterium]